LDAADSGQRSSRLRWALAVSVLLVVAPLVPGLDSDFGRSLLTQMTIAAVFALSFNLLFGQTGLLSFGHAVYFGPHRSPPQCQPGRHR
jgi:branched-chain amino acid transport system permease protein